MQEKSQPDIERDEPPEPVLRTPRYGAPSGGMGAPPPYGAPATSTKGGLNLPAMVLVGAVAVILSVVAVSMFLKPVSTTQLDQRLAPITKDTAKLATDITNANANVAQINKDLSAFAGDVTVIKGNYVTSVRLNDSLGAMQANIATVQGQVQTVKDALSKAASTDEVKVLQTKVTSLDTQLTSAQAVISKWQSQPSITGFTPISGAIGASVTITGTNLLGATAVSFGGTPAQSFTVNSGTDITAVVGTGSTGAVSVTTTNGTASFGTFTYATNTTTGTTGLVSATVLGNAFTGSQTLNFAATTANTSATISQQFSFTIANGTGKTINNIQLAVALELLDSSSTTPLSGVPAGATINIISSGLSTIWTQQSTGIPYILGYLNSSTAGIFGSSIGLMSQTPGTATYTVTVTVTTTQPTPAFNIYPLVKVLNYN